MTKFDNEAKFIIREGKWPKNDEKFIEIPKEYEGMFNDPDLPIELKDWIFSNACREHGFLIPQFEVTTGNINKDDLDKSRLLMKCNLIASIENEIKEEISIYESKIRREIYDKYSSQLDLFKPKT